MKKLLSLILCAESVLALVLTCLIVLLLDDRYGFLNYRFDLTAFKSASLLIGVWVCLEIILFISGLIRKSSRQYSIRWIMLCMVAAAMVTVTFQNGERRAAAYEEITALEKRLAKGDGNPRRIYGDEDFELSMLTYEPINGHEELTRINFHLEETDCGC